MIEVQVKTANARGEGSNWIIGAKAQQLSQSDREWFAFVLVPVGTEWSAPRTFLVPRDHVAAAAWIVHQDWLTDPTVTPGKRNTPLERARVNIEVWQRYEDRWDLLNQPTHAVPILLPNWVRDLAQQPRVGLPPGHPWASPSDAT
jgi:hypothetical protein